MNPPPANTGGSGVALFPVSPREADEIGNMAAEIWPSAYRGIIPETQIEFMLRWMYSPSKLIEEMTRDQILYFWIISDDGRAGFLATGPSPDEVTRYQLHKFYLLPARQGKGVGGRAMELLIGRLAQIPARRLELRVNRHNARAIAFYRKHDFEVFAEDCREIGRGFVMDDFLMCRLISEKPKAPENG